MLTFKWTFFFFSVVSTSRVLSIHLANFIANLHAFYTIASNWRVHAHLPHSFIVSFQLFMIHWHASSFLSLMFLFFTFRSTTSGATATYQRRIWIRDLALIFCMRIQQQMRSNRCRWVVTFFRSWRFVNKEIHFRSGSATSKRRECLMMQPKRCYGSQDAEMPILI